MRHSFVLHQVIAKREGLWTKFTFKRFLGKVCLDVCAPFCTWRECAVTVFAWIICFVLTPVQGQCITSTKCLCAHVTGERLIRAVDFSVCGELHLCTECLFTIKAFEGLLCSMRFQVCTPHIQIVECLFTVFAPMYLLLKVPKVVLLQPRVVNECLITVTAHIWLLTNMNASMFSLVAACTEGLPTKLTFKRLFSSVGALML